MVGGGEDDRFHYFAFGSNLNVERLRINCKSAELVSTGHLSGFRLCFTLPTTRWNGAAADIRAEEEAEVIGAVWSIAKSELGVLDTQEGVSIGNYKRITCKVRLDQNNEEVECYAYQVVDPVLDLKPSKLYMRVIMEGAKKLGMPESYITFLNSVEANPFDDDEQYREALRKGSSAIF